MGGSFARVRRIPTRASCAPRDLCAFRPLALDIKFRASGRSEFLPAPRVFIPSEWTPISVR